MSKTINKAKLDEAIELVRTYYGSIGPDENVLHQMLAATGSLEKECELSMHTIIELLTSIVRPHSLKDDATNEDVYKVLAVLGWQVSDDDQCDD